MNTLERKQLILQRLQEQGNVSTNELAREFHVSTMTIRRDLVNYEKQGLVTLEHGGAVLNNGTLFEYNISQKMQQHCLEKQRIAERCVQEIKEGDSIYLDAGTTIAEVAKLICNYKNLTVLTHSLLVANTLAKSPSIKLIMCPGVFRETSMAFMGHITDEFIENYKIDKLFLAVEGISIDSGATVQDMDDGLTKAALVHNSNHVFCALDSSKFNKKWLCRICDLKNLDMIITDSGLDGDTAKSFKETGVPILLV